MARAGAAVALAFAVCCLLVAPAPARRPVDLPPGALHAAVDRSAAAEPLRPKPVEAAGCADAAEQGTAPAVPEEDPTAAGEEEEEPRQRPFLLCLFFRCGGEPAGMGSSEEPADRWVRPAVAGKAEKAGDVVGRPYDTDSDSDCDSDSDDEDEDGGVLGWLWRRADRF